ncbi:putative major facilitator superfamily [Phaeomoniella chlamydospora]|uniref:Putative major facilitator superfamily n=1 Tax=Phaeomoniella chlamydospora TaxID=158046 RepID=A0A0G2GVA9_PHACM|nr:putative major facilitator superfamily [Phaeomoniella chlamydospora]
MDPSRRALLTDWGMTWGTTLFEAQAAEWEMTISDVANSISGGIFLQGPGGVLAVPLIQRYGRLPVLFWSQLLSCAMVIAAALAPSYSGFTACRTLQGFFNTAPQVIGLTAIFILLLTMWTIGITTSITQFVKPPPYLFPDLSVALLYLAPTIGTLTAEIWGHYLNDLIQKRYIKTHLGVWRPENRLWGAWPAVIVSMGGLILLGQTLQHRLTWLGIAFGWGMNAFGLLAGTTVISTYILDCFPDHAAGASSWINMWRTTGGFCVSYFQLKWVVRNGPGVTFGIQAAIIAVGFTAIIATQFWGAKWRLKYLVPEPEN